MDGGSSFRMNSSHGNETESNTDNGVEFALQTAIMSIVFVSSLLGNSIVVGIFIRHRDLTSDSSHKLVLNLCIANLGLSLLVMPFIVMSTVTRSWPLGTVVCELNAFLAIFLLMASVLTLVLLSWDRYHCIVNPLTYQLRMTPMRSNVWIAVSWSMAFFMAVVPHFGWGIYGYHAKKLSCTVLWRHQSSNGYSVFFVIFAFLGPLLFLLWSYYHILKAAHKQARAVAIARTMTTPAFARSPQGFRNSITSLALHAYTGSKAWVTTLLVVGTFCVSMGPASVTVLMDNVSDSLQLSTMYLTFLGPVVYPLIYGFRVRKLRKAIKKMVYSWVCCCKTRVYPLGDDVVISPSAFRNRSASVASASSLDYRNSLSGPVPSYCLPKIQEEGVELRESYSYPRKTDSTDLLSITDLPGQVNQI